MVIILAEGLLLANLIGYLIMEPWLGIFAVCLVAIQALVVSFLVQGRFWLSIILTVIVMAVLFSVIALVRLEVAVYVIIFICLLFALPLIPLLIGEEEATLRLILTLGTYLPFTVGGNLLAQGRGFWTPCNSVFMGPLYRTPSQGEAGGGARERN